MMTIEGAVNTQVFDLYVEHFLVPELIKGDIVVLDNVKFHHSQRATSLIEAAGLLIALMALPNGYSGWVAYCTNGTTEWLQMN